MQERLVMVNLYLQALTDFQLTITKMARKILMSGRMCWVASHIILLKTDTQKTTLIFLTNQKRGEVFVPITDQINMLML